MLENSLKRWNLLVKSQRYNYKYKRIDEIKLLYCYRKISVSSAIRSDEKKPGLINRILRGDQYDSPTNAHSILLTNNSHLYKYQSKLATLNDFFY